jgi:two-component system response regulator NreC
MVKINEISPHSRKPKLSSREREILILLCEGHSNKQIAEALNLSTRTVEAYRARLMRKLRLQSLPELVRYAVRSGIVQA